MDYLFYLFKDNAVVMDLVCPEVGPAGVEGDLPPLSSHATRASPTNRGKRRRDASQPHFEAFVANAAKMAAAVCVDSSSRELVNLSETLKNLRAAGADPRFIAAVEHKLEQLLMPPAQAPVTPGNDGASGSTCEAPPAPAALVDDAPLDLEEGEAEGFF